MVSATLERAKELKQALADFAYDAEEEFAVALEAYVARYGSRERQGYDLRQQNLLVDTFLSEGRVGDASPLELFLKEEKGLSDRDRALVRSWQRSFTGLFEVIQIQNEQFILMNWLTAKHYPVFPSTEVPLAETQRWKSGEILLTRLAPISEKEWMFSGACIAKGNLGKPKLAVAIGEFKKNYPDRLYSDAPELLEQAWDSVAQYHQDFVEFFGSDRITLPGDRLSKKLTELQAQMSQKRLAAAGIDSSKSLKELSQAQGLDEEELKAAAIEAGADSDAIAKTWESKLNSPMVSPKIELPDEIKKAERVTVFSHPRWGQTILSTYARFQDILEASEPQEPETYTAFVRKYLADPQVNYFIWQQLQAQYPTQLEKVLQTTLQRPDFKLERDLAATLIEFKKPLEPELPEIASVPQHLHNLFEEAMARVNKSKAKGKKKQKKRKGFQ